MKLEYRLDDGKDYRALWHYTHLSTPELVSRLTCEYFVKNNQTFMVTGTRKESDISVVYLQENGIDQIKENSYSHIGLEIKEILSPSRYHTLQARELYTHEEALELFHYDVIVLNGREFYLDSRELDEDRNCYVYYGSYNK